jgi:hypothetical protein
VPHLATASTPRPRRQYHHHAVTEEHFLDARCAAIDAGVIPGPRLLCATRGITASNGHGRAHTAFDGVDEIRRGVRENFQHGADHVKVFATGGVSSSNTTLQASVYSRRRSAPRWRRRIGWASTPLPTPTAGLACASRQEGGPPSLLCRQRRRHRPRRRSAASGWSVPSIFAHPGIEQGDGRTSAIMEKVRWARRQVAETFPRHLASGIRIAVGTDSMHGLMAFEMATLVRLGVSAHDALIAGTRGARLAGSTATWNAHPGKRGPDRHRGRPPEKHRRPPEGEAGHKRRAGPNERGRDARRMIDAVGGLGRSGARSPQTK